MGLESFLGRKANPGLAPFVKTRPFERFQVFSALGGRHLRRLYGLLRSYILYPAYITFPRDLQKGSKHHLGTQEKRGYYKKGLGCHRTGRRLGKALEQEGQTGQGDTPIGFKSCGLQKRFSEEKISRWPRKYPAFQPQHGVWRTLPINRARSFRLVGVFAAWDSVLLSPRGVLEGEILLGVEAVG